MNGGGANGIANTAALLGKSFVHFIHKGRKPRGENLMLWKGQTKESAVFTIILRRFLVIFSTYLSQKRGSDGHFEVLNRSEPQLVQKL